MGFWEVGYYRRILWCEDGGEGVEYLRVREGGGFYFGSCKFGVLFLFMV